MKATLKEVLTAIMNLIDKDTFSTDCGGDFQGNDCESCNYYYNCLYGEKQAKQAKDCRLMINNLKIES